MSKGPGRVERKLREILEAAGEEAAFPVEELCSLVYGYPLKKQHHLAVVRASNNIIKRGGNYAWFCYGPGRHNHKVLYVPDNGASYAKARIVGYTSFSVHWWRKDQVEAELTRCSHLIEPGGAWWRDVEIVRAERCGDQDRAAMLTTERDAELAELNRKRRLLGLDPMAA